MEYFSHILDNLKYYRYVISTWKTVKFENEFYRKNEVCFCWIGKALNHDRHCQITLNRTLIHPLLSALSTLIINRTISRHEEYETSYIWRDITRFIPVVRSIFRRGLIASLLFIFRLKNPTKYDILPLCL